MKVAELRAKAAELGIDYVGVRKPALVEAIYEAAARAEGFRPVEGILEIGNEGYGWIRTGNYMEGDGIKALTVGGVEPTQANVESGDFTIWAYEHMYTREDEDESTAAVTQAFIEFIMSDDFASTVVEEGFIPMADMQVKKDAEGNITAA